MPHTMKSLGPMLVMLAFSVAACGPIPPAISADGYAGSSSSSADPNQSQNSNSEDPNASNNPNTVVASFFANAADDANTLYVVITSDPNFCTNYAAGQIKLGVEVQIQIDDVRSNRSTYKVAGEAQITSFTVDTCQPEGNQGTSGEVQLTSCNSGYCAGSYTNVQLEDGTPAKGYFSAQPCTTLQEQGMPFGGSASLTCSQ